eukprot:comp20318_c0_seq1/m.25557 comp20318_c0_seq1/g.25557  ORF comp20318_c0_seq1/g.25557 comp20318_c0_seq1/m.25557 type:complete len:275 (-) comp20318_c0_seq1:444-1268(-)
MAAGTTVRVLVVGDSGVGKTAFVHAFAQKEVLRRPYGTVGCNIDIKLHEHEGSTWEVELWDIGGSAAHRKGRPMFYQGVHGIILVHDLSNRKSYANLDKWVYEVMSALGGAPSRDSGRFDSGDDFDEERTMGEPSSVPMIIVGTKQDAVRADATFGKTTMRSEYGDTLQLSCMELSDFQPDSTAMRQLGSFLDRVIARRLGARSSRDLSGVPYGAYGVGASSPNLGSGSQYAMDASRRRLPSTDRYGRDPAFRRSNNVGYSLYGDGPVSPNYPP